MSARAIIQLTRLERPVGWMFLFLPGLWGWLLIQSSAWVLGLILLGSIWARSLGCVYNDYVDAPLDAQVTRTCRRFFVHSSLTPSLWIFFLSLWVIGVGFWCWILPWSALILGAVGTAGALIYPWLKRWISFPQIWLAWIFNLNVFMPFSISNQAITSEAVALYIYGMLWTLSYDTIYALQDYEDDRRMGIGSLAVWLDRKRVRLFLTICLFLRFMLLVFWWPSVLDFWHMVLLGLWICTGLHTLYRCNLYQRCSCDQAFHRSLLEGIIVVGLLY